MLLGKEMALPTRLATVGNRFDVQPRGDLVLVRTQTVCYWQGAAVIPGWINSTPAS